MPKQMQMENTGAKMDLRTLESARNSERGDAGQVVYVIEPLYRGGGVRALTSNVSLANTQPGTHLEAYSHQTGRFLGFFIVRAIWYLGSGEVYGKVPRCTVRHYVAH